MKKSIHAIFAMAALLSSLSGMLTITACSDGLDNLLVQLKEAIRNYDLDKAKVLSEKACDKNSDFGCYVYAGLLAKGNDYHNALKMLEKSCDLNHKGGCAEAGLYYYYGAYGTTPDTLKAMEYYKRGCDIDGNDPNADVDYKQNIAIGCYRVGSQSRFGKEKPIDEKNANKYYEKACKLGIEYACKIIDPTKTEEDADYLVIQQSEAIRNNNFEKAKEYAEKACEKNNDLGCFTIGELLTREQENSKAIPFLEKGCNLNNNGACVELGVMYLNGKGSVPDTSKAIKLLEKSCNLKVNQGCFLLGGLYKLGNGVPANKEKAKEYFTKACHLGLREACRMK